MQTSSELLDCIFKDHPVDETLVLYILDILEGGNLEDIVESIPPLFADSLGVSNEEAKEVCLNMLIDLGVLRKGEYTDHSKPSLLQNPFQISKEQLDLVGAVDSSKNAGNTYEVVNISSPPPMDEDDECVSLEVFLNLTHHQDPITRKKALREMCPCHVKHNVRILWDRILEMTQDPDSTVRYQVLHNLCDGSPNEMEETVIHALEGMHNDEDKYIRRRVHQILANYRRTGKWNIM